jgi:hypothetical protein
MSETAHGRLPKNRSIPGQMAFSLGTTISIDIVFTRAWKDGCQSLMKHRRH